MTDLMTVTGPVPPEALGITLTHEHLFMDIVGGGPSRDRQTRNRMLNDPELAYRELMRFEAAGGATVVDLTSGGMKVSDHLLGAQHPLAVRDLAVRTGLNIVLGTGWYTEAYYDERLYRMSAGEIADELVRDVTEGIDGTEVRAGILGEIGSGATWITPAEERLLRATARAHKRTGVAIATHTAGWRVGLQQLDILEEEGVDARRVIIGHCHSYPDHAYHAEIARRGAFVSFDRLGTTNEYERETDFALVRQMIDDGGTEHLLLSHNVSLREDYVAYGGKGYEYLPAALRTDPDLPLTEEQFHRVMVDNPRRALTGEE